MSRKARFFRHLADGQSAKKGIEQSAQSIAYSWPYALCSLPYTLGSLRYVEADRALGEKDRPQSFWTICPSAESGLLQSVALARDLGPGLLIRRLFRGRQDVQAGGLSGLLLQAGLKLLQEVPGRLGKRPVALSGLIEFQG